MHLYWAGVGRAAFLAGLVAVGTSADTIIIRSMEKKGDFQSYADSKFVFDADGKTLKEPRSSVTKMVMDPPCEASLVQGSKTLTVKLLGYEQTKFLYEIKGVKGEAAGMLVKSIAVRRPMEGGDGSSSDTPRGRKAINIAAYENAVLTPDQAAAVARYKKARTTYDAFVAKSSEMVAEMDKTKGPKREELLTALRVRKNEEQPIANELAAAEQALLKAIPPGTQLQLKEPAAGAPEVSANPPSGPATLPETPEGEIVMIDTASIEAIPNLKSAQKDALAKYKDALSNYLRVSNMDSAPEEEKKAAAQELKKLQKSLLAAFPEMTFKTN